ncbi:hypothetical protein FisN_8Hh163 [Fistulifera solaris]|uniref:Uncharacterized protein n=1 Tax=Fistulifera solaris TaxID=1519565 RepID=A0A1Z5JY61_FISSO|nr:hypothetical protein FisN_8Hh163 [Fistulifera solaris]|eukprot:GAX18944.1 hypothetical protein FisN_8Hh163 [Fistulifera solaris]
MASRSFQEFSREKYHSNQAAWSPSWLPNAIDGASYEKDYRIRDQKRTDRGTPSTEFPVTTERTRHVIPNSRHKNYDATMYGSPQNEYPFLYSDPVDGASVQTGMSQQELLRQKARESKQRYKKSKTSKKPVVQITGFLSSRDKVATRWDDLSTADTTDSSLRPRTKSNSSSPLRVVLDGGDLVLTARQSRFRPEFTKQDDDFPLLSRSASGSFQMDFPSESFSGKGYELPNPPSIERERTAVYRDARFTKNFSNNWPVLRTSSAELRNNQSVQNTSSREWLLHSAAEEERAEKQHSNRSVQFRDEIVRPASFDSKNHSREVPKNSDRQPKSILRKSRYQTQSGGVRMSSSPSRFMIRKPATPERKNGQHLVKSPRSTYSPSGVLDETRRNFFPVSQDSEISGSSALSDESYPDPPLDSIPIDDDETTFASRKDDFLETVAAIVIQTNIRRFLAIRYVDRLMEQLANEMHAKYVRLYKNEHQINSDTENTITPSAKSRTHRVPAQKSPNRVKLSPQRTDHDRRLEENTQQKMTYDLYNLAAIRIQAAFRGFWARDSLDVDHFCATLIQRCVRRYLCETKYKYGHYHAYPYAVRIQTMWRGILAKQNLHRSIGAAILIQAYARGFIERRLNRGRILNTSRGNESPQYMKTETLTTSKSTGDSWQKGLANDLWQTRKSRMSESDNKNGFIPPQDNSYLPKHPFVPSMSSREQQNRSTNFTHSREQKTDNSMTSEPSQASQGSNVKVVARPYQQPAPSIPATYDRMTAIKVMAATKIQARYRTHTCERKLIRSLVDILIVQTVARRWLARRRVARLRTLRDRCRTIVANREPESNQYQRAPTPRLVSRSEFFQNRVIPKGLNSHPQVASTQSGPSFDEDDYYHSEKERRGTRRDSSVHRVKSFEDNNRQSVNYGQRARGSIMETRDCPVSSQPPQWANVSLRSTKSKVLNERSRTPPQLMASSGSESRVYSIPSYDSEATNAAVQNGSSARRQVVVTPPALLKKNTDRQVVRR